VGECSRSIQDYVFYIGKKVLRVPQKEKAPE